MKNVTPELLLKELKREIRYLGAECVRSYLGKGALIQMNIHNQIGVDLASFDRLLREVVTSDRDLTPLRCAGGVMDLINAGGKRCAAYGRARRPFRKKRS